MTWHYDDDDDDDDILFSIGSSIFMNTFNYVLCHEHAKKVAFL